MNNLIKCSLIRSLRTFLQALVMTLPAGGVVTVNFIQSFDWVSFLYMVLAWIANALLIAFGTFVTCIKGGLPEVDLADDDLEFFDEEEEEDEY